LVLSCTFIISCSNNTDELSGTTWVLTYDPDSPGSPPDDMMVFKDKGKVDLRDSKSVYLSCEYEIADEKVLLNCNVKGKTNQMELRFSDDGNVLENPTGAEYSKQ
jgi:hypothetical protein